MKRLLAAILATLLCLTAFSVGALADGEEGAQQNPDNGTAVLDVQQGTQSAETPVPAPETPAPATETPTPLPESVSTPTPEPSGTPTPTLEITPTPATTPQPDAATPTPEVSPGNSAIRVTMGADLTAKQRAAVYADFGIAEGSVTELTVTNAEERAYLEGLVPSKKIGSVALSCIYIETQPAGTGLTVDLHNINYCTGDMYRNALTTAGISDAKVIVSAPYPVSGTGALTGAYKAYEDITGKSLSQLAKAVGAEELVVTGELAEYIGSDDATAIINELKGMLEQTQNMNDDEVKKEIRTLADAYKVTVTDGQVDQVLSLVRKLEGLDTEQLQKQLVSLAQTAQNMGKASQTVSKVFESVTGFFASIGSFFTKLFAKTA